MEQSPQTQCQWAGTACLFFFYHRSLPCGNQLQFSCHAQII